MTDILDQAAVEQDDSASSAKMVRNPYLTVIQCTEDEVLLRHGSRSRHSRVLQDESRRQILGPLLRAFESPISTAEAAELLADRAVPADVENLVEQLTDDGVLVGAEAGTFAVYQSLRGGGAVAGIGDATVGVLGLGQIGAQIGAQLAQLGVGEVVGLDDRGPDASAAKADEFLAAAKRSGLENVRALTGSLDDSEALAGLVDDSDLIVLALEGFRPSLLHRVNRVAVGAGKPFLPVYADGSELIIGPLVVPGESPCYNEHEIQHESSRMLRREFLLYTEELGRHGTSDLPTLLAPYAAIAASWAVIGALPFLVDGTSFLVSRAIRIDMERLEITQEHVMRLPRCPVCAVRRAAFRHPFL